MNCKHCGESNYRKNGFQGSKQKYKCKSCLRNFTEGDARIVDRSKEKAVCFLLYAMGKASMRFLSGIFKVSVRTIYLWIKSVASQIPEPVADAEIREIEIDEMWHYVSKKLKNYGCSRRLTVAAGELSHGLRVVVTLQRQEDYMIN